MFIVGFSVSSFEIRLARIPYHTFTFMFFLIPFLSVSFFVVVASVIIVVVVVVVVLNIVNLVFSVSVISLLEP